jgi:hypothetical protein
MSRGAQGGVRVIGALRSTLRLLSLHLFASVTNTLFIHTLFSIPVYYIFLGTTLPRSVPSLAPTPSPPSFIALRLLVRQAHRKLLSPEPLGSPRTGRLRHTIPTPSPPAHGPLWTSPQSFPLAVRPTTPLTHSFIVSYIISQIRRDVKMISRPRLLISATYTIMYYTKTM